MSNGNGKGMWGILKGVIVIAGGLTSMGLIMSICWIIFAQAKVDSCIKGAWEDPVNGHRIQTEKIADSTTRSYTDELYERQARMFFNMQAMMTEKQKMNGEKAYQDYIRDLKTRNKIGR